MWSKKGTPVSELGLPGAVEVELDADVALLGDALDECRAAHGVTTSRRAFRKDVVSLSVPAFTRSQPASPGPVLTSRTRTPRSSRARQTADGCSKGPKSRKFASVGTTSRPRVAHAVDHPVALPADVLDRAEQLAGERERGARGRLGERRQVVGQAHQAQRVDHLRRGRQVPDPRTGQRERLAHRAAHQQPRVAVQQGDGRRRAGELRVRLVDDHDAVAGGAERVDQLERGGRPGGVVRRRHEHHGRAVLGDGCERGAAVDREVVAAADPDPGGAGAAASSGCIEYDGSKPSAVRPGRRRPAAPAAAPRCCRWRPEPAPVDGHAGAPER
jgi:hypothetical protein